MLIGTALAALVPTLFGSNFYINLATQVLIAAIFASSYNVIAGWGGLVSFGHAAFFGAAGYGAALLVLKAGLGHLAAALLGLAFATVLAGIVGAVRGLRWREERLAPPRVAHPRLLSPDEEPELARVRDEGAVGRPQLAVLLEEPVADEPRAKAA